MLKIPDFTKTFVVEADASDPAVGAVLLQSYNKKVHPIAYSNKEYYFSERNYSEYKKELLAIYKTCQKQRYYLYLYPTTVYTNYKPWINLYKQSYHTKQ